MVHDQVLQFFQPSQMHPELCIAPARVLPHRGPRETVVAALDLQPRAFLGHHLVEQQQQAPRLRRQLVERWRQHFPHELQGQLHIVFRGLDVFPRFALARARLDLPLMLMKQAIACTSVRNFW